MDTKLAMQRPMQPIINLALFSVLITSAACATSPDNAGSPRLPTDAEVEQYNAQVEPEDRIVCRWEIPIGSNIRKRKCRMVRDVEETSDFHREQLRRALH